MDRWVGRVALVTGASSGIGRAIASRLARDGLKVVACARNLERLQDLKDSHKGDKGAIYPIKCDIKNESEILSMFDRIREEFGGVDVCINSAGVAHCKTTLLGGSTESWRDTIEVNFLALCICSREAIKQMKERNNDDGVVINIGSAAAYETRVPGGLEFYAATKQAVSSFSNSLANELQKSGSRIRVTEIAPGLVETEMLERSWGKDAAENMLSHMKALSVEDITEMVVYVLSLPPHAQVSSVVIRPTQSIDRVARDINFHTGATQSPESKH